jgi:hypothetical protein
MIPHTPCFHFDFSVSIASYPFVLSSEEAKCTIRPVADWCEDPTIIGFRALPPNLSHCRSTVCLFQAAAPEVKPSVMQYVEDLFSCSKTITAVIVPALCYLPAARSSHLIPVGAVLYCVVLYCIFRFSPLPDSDSPAWSPCRLPAKAPRQRSMKRLDEAGPPVEGTGTETYCPTPPNEFYVTFQQ